ncbi:MAG: hypothetical protein EOM24_03060 [Chloroflexia bacterium]|nr:hypothetical protein [Chloroflexia bacterium]
MTRSSSCSCLTISNRKVWRAVSLVVPHVCWIRRCIKGTENSRTTDRTSSAHWSTGERSGPTS